MKDQLIVRDPEILSGIPVFKGTRVPVKNLVDYLEAGDSLEEFLDDFPTVQREKVVKFLNLSIKYYLAHDDVFITIDNNLSAQQNLTKIDLAVIVLSAPNNRLETLKPLVPRIKEVIASIQTGEIAYI